NVLKRVPQVLIPYIGGAWGVVQCAEWLTSRYALSPLLVDFCLYLCLLMLPSVLLLAYYRGEPGATPWTRAERLGIPLNVGAAALVLLVAFHGKDLGKATWTVVTKDADGRPVQREVPKSAFRKHVALFFLDNESGDAGLDWLGQAISVALGADVEQE